MDKLFQSIKNIFGKSKFEKLVQFIKGKKESIDIDVLDGLLECYEKNDKENIKKMNSFFMLNNNFYNLCVHLTDQKKSIQLKIFALVRKLNDKLILKFPEDQTENFIEYLIDDKENQYCSLSLLEILLDDSAFYQQFVKSEKFIIELANGIDNEEFDIQALYLSIIFKLLDNNYAKYLFLNPKKEQFFDKLMNYLDKSNIYVKNRISETIYNCFVFHKEFLNELLWFVSQRKYYDISLKYLMETRGPDLMLSFDLYKLFVANPKMPSEFKETFNDDVIKNVIDALAVYSSREPDLIDILESETAIVVDKMRKEVNSRKKKID